MRQIMDFSGTGWRLWLDSEAKWKDDELHPPPVDFPALPVNPPTGGWDVLDTDATAVSVPGTVEEYTWDDAGDYQGVSWWWRTFQAPDDLNGRRVILQFEAVRLRAEVFLNRELVGYDAVGNTPFDVDLTGKVKPGANELAVRVTDPGGNFDWVDFNAQYWGEQPIPASHGFGGVTGPVRLLIVDPVYVSDVFVRNKPAMTEVDVEITVRNTTGESVREALQVQVLDAAPAGRVGRPDASGSSSVVFEQNLPERSFAPGETVVSVPIRAQAVRLWSPQQPNLYICRVTLEHRDRLDVRFGFRWFQADGIGENAVFRLNGRRVFLLSAISWGFWPANGIYPTRDLAEKQIRAAKALGMNMLNFHRCIGQPLLLDLADEMGLLYYEEPGGYTARGGDDLCFALAREKLLRMLRRDRNHPSLIIYNMINEEQSHPQQRHKRDMAHAHALDPTRTITYTSGWAGEDDDPIKLHMRPYDDTQYTRGWYDYHHAPGPGVYRDRCYNGPDDYYLRTQNREEIVFWGEEGAIATPPRLERIVAALKERRNGWDGADYRAWYDAYRRYLTDKNLREYFPSIDALTESMGNIAYAYQGRAIENARIGNLTDGYVINGWEAEKLENHSGMVDCFRNFKGDPQVLARYNRPLYLAVKPRSKVTHVGSAVTVDIYIHNQVDLHGPHRLRAALISPDGDNTWSGQYDVTISGGDVFGELLVRGVEVPIDAGPGRYFFRAQLFGQDSVSGQDEAATGEDDIFAVDLKSRALPGNGAVLEQDSTIHDFLKQHMHIDLPPLDQAGENLDYVLIGACDPIPREVIPSDVLIDASGSPGGLSAEYFKGADFQTGMLQRVDPTIDFDFSRTAPSPEIGATDLSVRWQGRIRPGESGVYRLYTLSDDGVRVWLDDRLIIERWSHHPPRLDPSEPIELKAGQEYRLRVDYFQGGGGAMIRLMWSTPAMKAEALDTARHILQRVAQEGTTAVFLNNTDDWAGLLDELGALEYRGRLTHGYYWLGGNFFVREHPLFDGLPVNQAMNWEYQALVHYGVPRYGLLLDGEEAVVGCVSDHQRRAATAVGVVPHGRGRILLSTLAITPSLNDPPGPADVTRKLFYNYIAYAAKQPD